jgi:hypothetical protein
MTDEPKPMGDIVPMKELDYWGTSRLICQCKRAELIKKRDRLNERIDALTYAIDEFYSDAAREKSNKFWESVTKGQ